MPGNLRVGNLFLIRGVLLVTRVPLTGVSEDHRNLISWNKSMKNFIKTFLRDEDGAALVEYGLALLVVALVGTGALITIAGDTDTLFTAADTATSAAAVAVAP